MMKDRELLDQSADLIINEFKNLYPNGEVDRKTGEEKTIFLTVGDITIELIRQSNEYCVIVYNNILKEKMTARKLGIIDVYQKQVVLERDRRIRLDEQSVKQLIKDGMNYKEDQ